MSDIDKTADKGSVWGGFFLVLVLHIALQGGGIFFVYFFDEYLAGVMFCCLGLTQFLYTIPASYKAKQRGETETLKGIRIGASLTFILFAACFGLVVSTLS